MPRSFTSAFKLLKWPSFQPADLKRYSNRLLIVGFILALAIPMGGVVVGRAATLSAENRLPAPPPTSKWKQGYSKEFDAYYADRTGGRRALLRLRNRIVLDAFRESPTPRVIIGDGDWLYLNTGFDPLDPKANSDYALEAAAALLRKRAAWCRERGIQYVVQIAREKHQVHPEYLPDHLRRHPPIDAVPLLQAACPDMTILDPRPLLLREAREAQVYYKRDTHWTPRGMLVGYRQLAEHLEQHVPGYRGKRFDAFTPLATTNPIGDLSKMMGATASRSSEPVDWYHLPTEGIIDHSIDELDLITETDRLKHIHSQCRSCPSPNGVRLLLLHDSFGITFRDFLAGDVANFTALGTYEFPKEWITKHKPTVIVQQFVERALIAHSWPFVND